MADKVVADMEEWMAEGRQAALEGKAMMVAY